VIILLYISTFLYKEKLKTITKQIYVMLKHLKYTLYYIIMYF